MITAKQHPPEPGMPKVEFVEPDLARWTFTTDEGDVQQIEFSHWCGWFGFDEDDLPHRVDVAVWLIRRSHR